MPPTPFIPIIEGSETFISLKVPLATYDKIHLSNIGVRTPVFLHLSAFFSPLGEFFPAPKSTSSSHLIGQPVSHIAIYPELDQFWFNYIASNSQRIKDRLLGGHKVFYLQRFTLSHDSIDLEFGELRLITIRYGSLPADIQAPFRIVHTSGRTHRYSWNTNSWEISTSNPDPALVDPEPPFFLPPLAPADSEYHTRVQEPLRYYTPDIDERIRGPSEEASSLATSSIPSVDSPPPPLEANPTWGPPAPDQG